MAWMRLEVSYIDHPKFLALSDGAFRLWHEGKSYCEKHLTDGLIPRVAAKGFRTFNDKRRKELQTPVKGYQSPLWESHDVGFFMHDYLDHNDSRELARARINKSTEERVANRRRKDVGRDRTLVRLIRARDGDLCRYCGVVVNWVDRRGRQAGTYDHINPGGPDSLTNVVVACRSCNSAKGNRSLAEVAVIGMRLRPAPDLAGTKPELSPETKPEPDPDSAVESLIAPSRSRPPTSTSVPSSSERTREEVARKV
jgi:5-methylcytosine-specific restriction endonuclease McrA